MPILRIPVVHKFGIISHSQRVELQKRLLKQTYSQSDKNKNSKKSDKFSLEVTDEFVNEYNQKKADNNANQARLGYLERKANTILERIKRKVAWTSRDDSPSERLANTVDTPIAWSQLAQLAQCKGAIQNECLNMLIVSLDRAPIDKSQIVALFFLAETCLYWLRTDSLDSSTLRPTEIKILRLGRLVFSRLFYHHMSGELTAATSGQEYDEFKCRLFTYLDGFTDGRQAYSGYPNALLCIRFMHQSGSIVVGDRSFTPSLGFPSASGDGPDTTSCSVDPDKPAKPRTRSSRTYSDDDKITPISTLDHEIEHLQRNLYVDDLLQNCVVGGGAQKAALRSTTGTTATTSGSSDRAFISGSVHDLCATLWHSLDVWRTTRGQSAGQREALDALRACADSIVSESWIDVVCAFQILGDAAKHDLAVLLVVFHLAEGFISIRDECSLSAKVKSRQHTNNTLTTRQLPEDSVKQAEFSNLPLLRNHTGLRGLHVWPWEVAVTYVDLLTGVVINGATSSLRKAALVGVRAGEGGDYVNGGGGGLIALTKFGQLLQTDDRDWRVRYSAVRSLVRVCALKRDSDTEGLVTTATAALQCVTGKERDSRVLEAFAVGQVDADLEIYEATFAVKRGESLASHVSVLLAELYLPPLPEVYEPTTKRRGEKVKSVFLSYPVRDIEFLRPSLRDEINVHSAFDEQIVDYNTRHSFDLMRVVEDRWRKDKQSELSSEIFGKSSENKPERIIRQPMVKKTKLVKANLIAMDKINEIKKNKTIKLK